LKLKCNNYLYGSKIASNLHEKEKLGLHRIFAIATTM
jgi:hypothetical protein